MRGLRLTEVADAVGLPLGTLSVKLSRGQVQGLDKPRTNPGSAGASYDIGEATLIALFAAFDRMAPDTKGTGRRAWQAYQQAVPYVGSFLAGQRREPGDDVFIVVLAFRSHEEVRVVDRIEGLNAALTDALNRGAAVLMVPFSRVFAPILARWVEANPELLTAPAPAEQEPADV